MLCYETYSYIFIVGVTNCAGGKECVFPIDQDRRQQQQSSALQSAFPDAPPLGAVARDQANMAAVATKAMPEVNEGSSRDWTDFKQWMATGQDSEPYPVEEDEENEPTDHGEHESAPQRFSEVNPFGLPEGEPEDISDATITREVFRSESPPSQSEVPPPRLIAFSHAPVVPSSGRKVATGSSAYGQLQATLAFSQPETRAERQSKVGQINAMSPQCWALQTSFFKNFSLTVIILHEKNIVVSFCRPFMLDIFPLNPMPNFLCIHWSGSICIFVIFTFY